MKNFKYIHLFTLFTFIIIIYNVFFIKDIAKKEIIHSRVSDKHFQIEHSAIKSNILNTNIIDQTSVYITNSPIPQESKTQNILKTVTPTYKAPDYGEFYPIYYNPCFPIITGPPPWAGDVYKKCLFSYGIAILSTDKVKDEALFRAYWIVDAMLKKLAYDKPSLMKRLVEGKSRIIIVGKTEYNNNFPELKSDPNGKREAYTEGNISVTLEEGLIVNPNDKWFTRFNITCHEFAHNIYTNGIEKEYPELVKEIEDNYLEVIRTGKYVESSYDLTNIDEFFAGQVGRWFNCGTNNLNVYNADKINDRQQLKIYDPKTYNALSKLFGEYQMPDPWKK